MVFSSSYISQQIAAGQHAAASQAAYAQQLSYGMAPPYGGQPGMMPGMMMPPPPAPPPMTLASASQGMQTGMYGEQMAARMAGVGGMGLSTMGSIGGIGLGLAGLDPFGLGIRAAMGGGGLIGGLGVGMAAALPMYAGSQIAQHYGSAFQGGMQDQAALNSTLRNSFQFFGGQGAMGRGFNQSQMGQIGGMVQRELNSNVFASAGEMNQLISGGAEAGMFSGVRDVQQFTQRFRRMLDTLKTVQDELGGTLTEALSFVRQSRQAGIFQQVDRSQFASQIRGAEAATGMNRQQLMGLATQGAQLSRAVGGLGRQGAFGAMRTASGLGSAIQAGVINEEALSEATGGLQGADAVQAFTSRMMQRSARFSRRGMGRFSIFSMSNREGTGLDADMVERFRSGDLTTGEVSRRAHRNVNRMGRAQAMNQEGRLRGSLLEQGGMAGQIGMMRLMVGDQVLDQNDNLASLVLQRRFHMSRPESEIALSMMRNQGEIAQQETFTNMAATRQQRLQTDIRENRSIDAFTRRLDHSVQEATGTLATRELGRKFVTRISSLAERVMNDILGVSENRMGQEDRAAMNRLITGRASDSDMERLALSGDTGGAMNTRGGMLERWMGRDPSSVLRARGGGRGNNVEEQMRNVVRARQGLVEGSDSLQLQKLENDVNQSRQRILLAQVQARGSGRELYDYMGGASANATDAFMQRNGMTNMGLGFGAGALMGRGGGALNEGNIGRDIARMGLSPAAMAAQVMSPGLRSRMGFMESEVLGAVETPQQQAAEFFAGGGQLGADLRREGYRTRSQVRNQGVASLMSGGINRRTLGNLRDTLRGQRVGSGEGSDLLTGLTTNSESVMALAGNDAFRRRFDRILATSDGEGLGSELDLLAEQVAGIEDPGQQAAANSMLQNLRRDSRRGGLSETNRRQLQALRYDPERQNQIREARNDAARGFREASRGLGEGTLGGMAGKIDVLLRGTGDPRQQIQEFYNQAARMDPESEEGRAAMEAIGGAEGGRAMMGEIAQRRRLQRELSGRGRRGSAGRAAAGLGLVTGNSLGSMELSLGGRRIRNAGRIEQILSRGGDDAESLISQMTSQMGANEETSGLIRQYAQSLQSGRGRGRLDEGEQDQLITAARSNDQLREIQRRGMEQQQRQQNPLDSQRNDLLTRIAESVGKMADRAGQPTGEP